MSLFSEVMPWKMVPTQQTPRPAFLRELPSLDSTSEKQQLRMPPEVFSPGPEFLGRAALLLSSGPWTRMSWPAVALW